MEIEKYFILNKYLLSLFGADESKRLFDQLRDINEGVDSNGNSYFINTIKGIKGLKNEELTEDMLLKYDKNIQDYVEKINFKRDFVSLKYFQYLAVLFTEIILDNLKNRRIEFLNDLNEFSRQYVTSQNIGITEGFTENDLSKLAFWMATGSGKTLVFHIHYYQFLKYSLFFPNNIILITPNEGLSRQHYEELEKSGIPCRLYGEGLGSRKLFANKDEVLIIEITKLVEERRGGGVTVSVDAFEDKNLVFVDEGHKGKKSGGDESGEQAWARVRNKIAKSGFTFEYSATFGQVLSQNNKETLKEYAKSMVFDYSYRYFYLDGYGKDFSVFNISETRIEQNDFQELMFVANLLSFYEQVSAYENDFFLAKQYNLEKPLWIFVGTTVTGKNDESDVVQIFEFIRKAINDENWLADKIKIILNGEGAQNYGEIHDAFKSKFEHLRKSKPSTEDVYRRIFGGKGDLRVYELKNATGELGLKVGENKYFGVINIGNVPRFKKQLELKGISISQDVISNSLFESIKQENSSINILIGSKKFMEGWDTWRVSSMGLLNIGKGHGPQIIQLFGRGVRLKGKDMSLKRSNVNGSVKVLETLNIYGFKADYLNKFLDAIAKEEVDFETVKIPIELQHEEKWKSLYMLTKDANKKFEEEVLILTPDDKIACTIDLSPKLSIYSSSTNENESGVLVKQLEPETQKIKIEKKHIDLFDWNRIWREMCNFKISRRYWNLVFTVKTLKDILLLPNNDIYAFPQLLEIKSVEDISKLEDVAVLMLKKYIDTYYKKHMKRYETENLYCVPICSLSKDAMFDNFDKCKDKYCYTLQINRSRNEGIRVLQEIEKVLSNLNKLIKEDTELLPHVYFDRHLYLPILVQSNKIDKISPVGLVEGEKKFVLELRDYLKKNQSDLKGIEIYLLRNYPKVGVGFFHLSGFYPDFIMWIKSKNRQAIIFIDPKGLKYTQGLKDEKIQLHKEIKKIEEKLQLHKRNIILESFVLSVTPYSELVRDTVLPHSKDEYEKNNVLFLEDRDWPQKLLAVF